MEFKVSVLDMWILVNMIDTLRIEGRCPTLDAVDDIAFFEQKFGEV